MIPLTTKSLLLIGACVCTTFAVGAAITLAVFFYGHRQSEAATAQTARGEFQQLRARFSDGQPLIGRSEGSPVFGSGPLRTGSRLTSFHAVIFDTRGGQRMVRISVPYRLGCRFAGKNGFRWLGQLTFLDDTEFDPEPIQLTVSQIERHGPGLLADFRHPSGGQFMAWVE